VGKKTVNIISLGCPRNLVDSELILGLLEQSGYKITNEVGGTDIVIVNTCGFIEDAKKESIDVILQLAGLKKENKISYIVVAGCLSQRYRDELKDELGEVDAFLGVGDINEIPLVLDSLKKKEKVIKVTKRPKFLYTEKDARFFMTPSHYAYVKIQEGCSNRCSYCVIPDLRGDYRSRRIESVVKEVDSLLEKGVSEINLIGQDTTSYGTDLYGKKRLPELLKELASLLKKETWIRLLYTHPAHFTDELIDVIRDYPVCKYIDLPIQHINDSILKKMGRRTMRKEIVSLIEKIRKKIPGVALRTSLILGFPGETEAQFKDLLQFLKDVRFERLGAFIYSREESTRAYSFDKQVSQKVKNRRFDETMKLQQSISAENNKRFLSKTVRVLVDKRIEGEDNLFLARTQADAPEVDGCVYLKAEKTKIGGFADAKITDTLEYDLVGKIVI
jgi:ribosomal protein S12 methylthiotransferase